MNISAGFVYLKNVLSNGVKTTKKFVKTPEKVADKNAFCRDEAIAQEMRMMLVKSAQNYAEPLQKEFKCTKDMFRYAKNRCLDGIHKGYEHVVIMDAKKNKIIAEFKGKNDSCSIKEIKGLKYESDNIVLMHGHPENFPLSSADVGLIKDYGLNKVIAISPEGDFSLISKQKDISQKKYKKAFFGYNMTSNEDSINYQMTQNKGLWKLAIDDTLREYAPQMGYRYVTNYSYLKKPIYKN